MKLIIALLLLPTAASSNEQEVNQIWCANMNGEYQFRTKDGTYVDCLTNKYAVEVEYDFNWKEAIGQSLHYAESTDRKAAILIIKHSQSKKDYLSELDRVISKFKLPIQVFVTEK